MAELNPTELTQPEPRSAWKGSIVVEMLENQRKLGMEPTALMTDWNGSLWDINTKDETRRVFELCEQNNIPIVISTGNDLTNLLNDCKNFKFRPPEVILCAVGTEIYVLHGLDEQGNPKYIRDEAFDKKVAEIPFNRHALASKAMEVITQWGQDTSPNNKFHLQFQLPEVEKRFITSQDISNVQKYKLSFYALAKDDQLGGMIDALTGEFSGFAADSRPVISVCEDIDYNRRNAQAIKDGEPKKYCIDLLPCEPKSFAINYIAELLYIQHALNVGDSGNDVFLTTKTHVGPSVIPVGAKPELIDRVRKDAVPSKHIKDMYRIPGPKGRKKVFIITNGPAAAGSILEATIIYLEAIIRVAPPGAQKDVIVPLLTALKKDAAKSTPENIQNK